MNQVCAAALVACLVMAQAGAQAAPSPGAIVVPSDMDIRKLLEERVRGLAGREDRVGIVVGIVGPQGRRVVAYGHARHGDPRPVDGDTGFEIGSVTKVFTALVLADMVVRGEIGLEDPVAKHLPRDIKVPGRRGRPITLLDLATHTSGLPFMPDQLPAFDDPTAKYSPAQLHQFLARYELSRDVGAQWEYSNVGYWLLGQALASRTSSDYESLLLARVLEPLRLESTAITPSPKLVAKLAVGHDAVLQPAPFIATVPVFAVMPAGGGLVSTANDLSTLLSVALGYKRSPLAPAMAAMLRTRRPGPQPGVEQALGWTTIGEGDDSLIVHDGGTLGHASSVAWDPKRRIGVVVLSNQVSDVGDLARHLLRPSAPLTKPSATKRTEIILDAAVLDAYAGRYEAPGEGPFVVVREGTFLTIQPPASWGLPKMRLRAETPWDFFVAQLPMRVTFQTDGDGRVDGLLIHPPRGQEALHAIRTGSDRRRDER